MTQREYDDKPWAAWVTCLEYRWAVAPFGSDLHGDLDAAMGAWWELICIQVGVAVYD